MMMRAYHAGDQYGDICDGTWETAGLLWDGQYFGMDVHSFEMAFIKSNWDIDPIFLDRLTKWTMARGIAVVPLYGVRWWSLWRRGYCVSMRSKKEKELCCILWRKQLIGVDVFYNGTRD